MKNYTITEAQVQRMYNICEDATGMVECNCGYTAGDDGPACDGTCTYSMAEAMLKELATLPVVRLEAAEAFVEDELERRRTGLFADEDPYIAEAEAALAAITKVIAAR